jgi:hypothetical protein
MQCTFENLNWYFKNRTNYLQGTEYTVIIQWPLGQSRSSSRFKETVNSLSCSQKPATGPYLQSNGYSPHPPALFLLESNMILPSTLGSPKHFLPSRFCSQNFTRNRSSNAVLSVSECSYIRAAPRPMPPTAPNFPSLLNHNKFCTIICNLHWHKINQKANSNYWACLQDTYGINMRSIKLWNEHPRVLLPDGFNGHGIHLYSQMLPH